MVQKTGKQCPVRKVNYSPNVQQTQLWEQFMTLDECMLHEMMLRTVSQPNNCRLVVGGGFPDPDSALANNFDAEDLCVDHEEADT